MSTNTKHSQGGQTDTGLLFTAGLFFLTLALALAYVSFFGLAPLSKAENRGNTTDSGMPAAAVLAVADTEAASATSSDPKVEEFFAALSQIAVKEIFIGSYGDVDSKVLVFLRDETERTFGVKTTILAPGAPIPQEAPFYDKARKQYDSDTLLESIKQSSSPYGASVRFLYVADIDMSSLSRKASPLWLRAEADSNASLISLHNLGTAQEVLFPRAKKAALYAIGTTAGFGLSPSVSDASCIMHSAVTMIELDKQEDTFCEPETDAIPLIFLK